MLLGGRFLFVVVVKTLVATLTDSVLLPAVHVPSRFGAPAAVEAVRSVAGVVPCAAGYSAPACWRRPGLPTAFCFEEGGGELAHCQDAVECRLARVELRVVLRDLAYVSLSASARLVGEVGLQVQKRCAHRRG